MSKLIKTIRDIVIEIEEKTKNQKKGLLLLSCIALALLIVAGPIVVLFNCLIFVDYTIICSIGIAFCFALVYFFAMFFYYQTLANKQVDNIIILHLGNFVMSLFYALILIVIFLLFN